jgi:V/A-type H+-transporting ATPase subunit I
MKNPKLIEPFELITSTYGMPAYRTIDPTPLVALSFVLMFGVMFGDVGHGAILAILGFLLSFRTPNRMKRQAGAIMMYAGFSSIIFGFLFGSIFGVEDFLPTLWLKPMESIPRLFKTAIFFGMGMIFMSITINVINGLLRKDILHVLLDKAGLVAAVLYWCGIVVATRVVSANPTVHKEVPILVPILMIAAVLLLFFREPIVHLAEGKKQLYPEGVGTGMIGGFMEVFEILLGFLTNTISFIRVAAFGLAHAGLFMAIFSLSDMVGGVGSVFVHLFGNILIIGLEGMVVTIQVMRLEFYEFFGRFFREGTKTYQPVHVEMGSSQ